MELKELSAEELRGLYQDFEIEDEEFVPLIFNDMPTRYKISKYGNILGVFGNKLKWSAKWPNGRKNKPYALISMMPTEGKWSDGDFTYQAKNKAVTVYIHRLVAEHFLPFPEYLPEELKEDWGKISKNTQNIIKSGLQVDHIDENSFNPRWDNLEWVTGKENSRRSIKSRWNELYKNNS